MHCQKPLCLNATNWFFFVIFSKGSLSKYVLSFLISFKKSGFITKKPPLIQPSSKWFFSLKYLTLSLIILIVPKRAGGLTAVTVTSFFSFMKSNQFI